MADKFLEEAKAFEQEAEDDPYAAIGKLSALASSYAAAILYRNSLVDVTEIIAAYKKISKGQHRRGRALMLLMGSPAAKDLQWKIDEAQEVEDRLLAEVS